jgi:hypothetical protein
MIKIALPTSTLDIVKEPNFTSSPIMMPPHSLPTNMASSSISTNLEVQSLPKINYFANLPSDNDESDDEFDLYTIFYLNNLITNRLLLHSRTLVYFDSSTIILKVRILELEKMIIIYQTNMDELERTKLV